VQAIPHWGGFPSSAERPPEQAAATDIPKTSTGSAPVERVGSYGELDVVLDRETTTFWCMMRPKRSCFGLGLLGDLAEMQRSIRRLFIGHDPDHPPVRYFVVGSHAPGIFNLGGDLALFAELIRQGDRDKLQQYSRACIDVVYNNSIGYELPIVTIAMVQGNALGGGFEAVLSCDVIIAEESAKFGLPEILFNLFPGMGAYSFLSRRISPRFAETMIASGRIYEAAELLEAGVIDMVVKDGEASEAVRSYISRHQRRHNAEHALFKVRRRINPVSYDELRDVTEMWVEAALKLSESDLRKMERISATQDRRLTGASAVDAAESLQAAAGYPDSFRGNWAILA
jgi:DSF synthase